MKTGSALVAACLAVAAFSEGFAEEVYDETTGFVTLLKSDGNSGKSGSSLDTAGNWSDGLPPHNDPPTNYYVQSGWYAWAESAGLDFPSPLYVAGSVVPRGISGDSANFADLKLLDGGCIRYGWMYYLGGNIEILATDESNPAVILYARSDAAGMRLRAVLSGNADSLAEFSTAYPQYRPYLRILDGSDWTAFKGKFRIADNLGLDIQLCSLNMPGTLTLGSDTWMYVKAGYPCSFGGLQFGNDSVVTNYAKIDVSGTLRTGTNMTWRLLNSASRISTVGTMEIADGTYMNFTVSSGLPESFHVTSRLAVGRDVSMDYAVDGVTDGSGAQAEFPMFRMSPEAVSAGLPDFASLKVSMKKVAGALPVAYVDVRDDSETEGGKIAYLTHRPVIRYCGENQFNNEAAHSMDTDVSQVGVWTDGKFPHPDCDYYMGSNTNIAFRPATAEHPNRVTTFPGGALALNDLAVIYLCDGVDVCISNLHAYGRGTVYQRGVAPWLRGKLTLHRYNDSHRFVARVYSSGTLHLESDLSGDGDMNANNYYPSNNGGTLYLGGMSTNWTGKLVSSWSKSTSASSPDASETVHLRIVAGDARSFGGGNDAFLHNAVQLANYLELRLTNTTEFAEANRGFLVSENGMLNVDEGMTATLRAPLTLDGTLRKIGGGTLALGGRMRFGLNDDLEDATAPTADRNVVLVQAGALKVVGADALDGAAVSFADGTSLHLDMRSADEGLQQNGFAFTNALSSIASTGTLPIVFDGGSAENVETSVTVPVCTVADAASAATLAGRISALLDMGEKKRRGALSVRENANGTATIQATFSPCGFLLMVR